MRATAGSSAARVVAGRAAAARPAPPPANDGVRAGDGRRRALCDDRHPHLAVQPLVDVAPKMMLVSSVAAPRTTSAASLTSSRSDPRRPRSRAGCLRADDLGVDERRLEGAPAAAGAIRALRVADPSGRAGVGHDRAHVGEVEVDQAGHRDQVADALHTCRSTSSAILNASTIEVERSMTSSSRSFGITITVSQAARSASTPESADWRRFVLEPERRRHDADRQAPRSRAILATTGAAPVPVPPPRRR